MSARDPEVAAIPADDAAPPLVAADGVELDARVHSAGTPARAAVLLVHGINTDLDEGGMYARLGERLAAAGLGVLRFSFRGHGRSGGSARGVTVAGEMLDVEAAADAARARWPGIPLGVVASSMGAVPVLESASFLRPDLLVLWNPVLDLRRTFLEPELPWGLDNFTPEAWAAAGRDGFLLLDGEFEMGRVLLAELKRYQPLEALAALATTPVLVIHGEKDTYVSFEVSRDASSRLGLNFHVVPGADHGFDTRYREDEAIAVTTKWLIDRVGAWWGRADTC
ncbi:alpha/beta hydrolase [Pseudonocardia hydrocarbonoxydans]|uniref:alpha/beta hydrolase n=1 Tax=Pseudonocardia hydrocarbonoxydans TaxID=76726 RepID=UPI0031D5369B